MTTLLLSKINIDNSTQARVGLNAEVVERYAECYKAGVKMPDIVLFADGNDFWLGDGFHRCAGAKSAGLTEIGVDIREGTRLDGLLYSLTCNNKNGMHMSNADKRNGVLNVLKEPAWASRSNRWVADAAEVSEHLVAKVREEFDRAAAMPAFNPFAARQPTTGPSEPESEPSTARGAQLDAKPPPVKRTGMDGKKRAPRKESSNGKHAGQSMADKAKQRLANRQGASAAPTDDGECTAHRCPSCGYRWEGVPVPERIKNPGKFVAPTVEDVAGYCKERDNGIDAEQFVDHYTSNGWKVGGKAAMQDWKAAVRTWEKNSDFRGKKKKETPAEKAARYERMAMDLPPIPEKGKK